MRLVCLVILICLLFKAYVDKNFIYGLQVAFYFYQKKSWRRPKEVMRIYPEQRIDDVLEKDRRHIHLRPI